jgi:hypothetical protein
MLTAPALVQFRLSSISSYSIDNLRLARYSLMPPVHPILDDGCIHIIGVLT